MPKISDCRIALVALIALAVWLFVCLPLLYLPSHDQVQGELLGVRYGEWVAAFGGIVGGIVGAGGAILAVYLAITGQRKEDIANVNAAIRTEITTYSKYVIGTLVVCQRIAAQDLKIPTVDAEYIGKSLVDPLTYPTVADRVGLMRRPQATFEFYMRIAEAKANLSAIQKKDSRLPQAQADMTYVQPGQAEVVADSLITALQMAKHIVGDVDPTRSQLDLFVQTITLRNIDEALELAQVMFPNAESFRVPTAT
jgi:hypothetical protein